MPIHRRFVILSPLAALAACTSAPTFRDGGSITAGKAPVLVYPRYGRDAEHVETVELTLTKVEPGQKAEDLAAITVANHEVSILAIPPGFYFLRRVRAKFRYNRFGVQGTDFEHLYEPKLTLFEVKAGRINYPGDWVIGVRADATSTSGSVGSGSWITRYSTAMRVEENRNVAFKLREKYPALNAQLPLRVTRLEGS